MGAEGVDAGVKADVAERGHSVVGGCRHCGRVARRESVAGYGSVVECVTIENRKVFFENSEKKTQKNRINRKQEKNKTTDSE